MRLTWWAAGAVAAAVVVVAWWGQSWAVAAAGASVALLGVPLSRVDLAEHRLPNRLVLVLTVCVAAALAADALLAGAEWMRPVVAAGSVAVLALPLGLLGWLGMGDVKLAVPLTLLLGRLGWSWVLAGWWFAAVLGVASAVVVMARDRTWRARVPMGPPLIVAVVVSCLLAA